MGAAAGPNVVEDGLVLALDAGNTKSYNNPPITYVGGTSDSDNSSSFTLSGLQSGDLVLYFSAEDSASVATPTGASWTAIPGLTTQPDNDNDPDSAAFYVFATGTSVTASGLNSGNENVRVMIAFRNVNSINPFDVNATENSGSSLPDPPSITPVTDNCMIVAVGLLDDHAIANSISPPTGYTTAVNMDSDGGANDTGLGGATIMTAYKLLATAAAEDPSGFTGTTGDPNKGISIALRQATSLIWTDLIGSNNGTLTNGPTFSSDNGGALVFDGTNDYVTISDTSDFTFGTGDLIVEAWFRPDSSAAVSASTYHTILSCGFPVQLYWINNQFQFFASTSNSANYFVNGGSFNSGSNSAVRDVWHHIVVTRTSNDFKMYLNGTLVDSASSASSFADPNIDTTIGATNTSGAGNFAHGRISNFKVYKGKGLTAAEVKQNYNALKGRYGY